MRSTTLGNLHLMNLEGSFAQGVGYTRSGDQLETKKDMRISSSKFGSFVANFLV